MAKFHIMIWYYSFKIRKHSYSENLRGRAQVSTYEQSEYLKIWKAEQIEKTEKKKKTEKSDNLKHLKI